MTNGLLERAARMVMREGFHFGGKSESSISTDLPTPETHNIRPVRHINPVTGRVQIAEASVRTVG